MSSSGPNSIQYTNHFGSTPNNNNGASKVSCSEICGEIDTLDIINEFRKMYETKLKEIDCEGGGDCMQLKIKVQQKWIEDLTEQTLMMARVVKELEMEASERVRMLEEKLRNSAESVYQVMNRYRTYDFNLNSDEPFQNDVQNLLEFIRRIRCDGKWSMDGLQFHQVNYVDLFGAKGDSNNSTFTPSSSYHTTQETKPCEPVDCPSLKNGQLTIPSFSQINAESTRIIDKNDETLIKCNEKIELLTKELSMKQAELDELRQAIVDVRDALTAEVACKHDIILMLKKEVQQIEERCVQADKQTAFKDDIIKELRKEIKQLKQQDKTELAHENKKLSKKIMYMKENSRMTKAALESSQMGPTNFEEVRRQHYQQEAQKSTSSEGETTNLSLQSKSSCTYKICRTRCKQNPTGKGTRQFSPRKEKHEDDDIIDLWAGCFPPKRHTKSDKSRVADLTTKSDKSRVADLTAKSDNKSRVADLTTKSDSSRVADLTTKKDKSRVADLPSTAQASEPQRKVSFDDTVTLTPEPKHTKNKCIGTPVISKEEKTTMTQLKTVDVGIEAKPSEAGIDNRGHELEETIKKKTEEVQALRSKVKELEDILEDSQDRAENLEKAVNLYLNSIQVLEGTEERAKTEIEQQRVTIYNLQEALVVAKQELDEFRQKSQQDVQQQSYLINVLYVNLLDLEKKNQFTENQLSNNLKNQKIRQDLYFQLEVDYFNSLQDIAIYETRLAKYQTEFRKQQGEKYEFSKEFSRLRTQSEYYENVITHFQDEICRMSSQLEQLHYILATHRESSSSKNKLYEQLISTVITLQEQNEHLIHDLDQLKIQCAHEDQIKSIYEAKLQHLQQIIDTNNHELYLQNETHKEMTLTLNRIVRENHELKYIAGNLQATVRHFEDMAKQIEDICNCEDELGSECRCKIVNYNEMQSGQNLQTEQLEEDYYCTCNALVNIQKTFHECKRKQMEKYKTIIESLQEKVEKIVQCNCSLTEQLDESEKNNGLLLQELKRSQSNCDGTSGKLKQKVFEAQNQNKELTKQLVEYKAVKDELNRRLQQTLASKAQVEAQLEQTLASNEQIKAELQQTFTNSEQLKSELRQTSANNEQIKTELKQTLEINEQLKADLEQTLIRKEEIKADMEFLKKKYSQDKRILDSCKHVMIEIKNLIMEMAANENIEEEIRAASCDHQRGDVCTECLCEVKVLQLILSRLKSMIHRLTTNLKVVREKNYQFEKDAKVFQTNFHELQRNLSARDRENALLRQEMKEKLKKAEEEERKLNEKIQYLKNELDKFKQNVYSVDDVELQKTRVEIAKLKDEIKGMIEKQVQLNHENNELHERVSQLEKFEETLNQSRQDTDHYMHELSQLSEGNKNLVRQNEELKNELQCLTCCYNQLEQKHRYISDSVRSLEMELNEVRNNRDDICAESRHVVDNVRLWLEEQRRIDAQNKRIHKEQCDIIERLKIENQTLRHHNMQNQNDQCFKRIDYSPPPPPRGFQQSPWSCGSQGTDSYCERESPQESPSRESPTSCGSCSADDWFASNFRDDDLSDDKEEFIRRVDTITAELRRSNLAWKNNMRSKDPK